MTSEPRAFLAIDLGSATRAAALVGRVAGRWRLLGSTAVPASVSLEPAIAALVADARAADAGIAEAVRLPGEGDDTTDEEALPRLVSATRPAPRLAVLAVTARHLGPLMAAADGAGWRTAGLSADTDDQLAITSLLLARDVAGVVLGASVPPAADERPGLLDLVRVVVAAASRRPDLLVVLAGAAADHADRFGGPPPAGGASQPAGATVGRAVTSPAATDGAPRGEALRRLLRSLRPGGDDGRDAIARATASLAEVLDRRVETIEVGHDAGLRCAARATGDGIGTGASASAIVAAAALFPPDPDDAVLAGIIAWSTVPRDRHRLRDRLRDLRRDPWGDADGDGALLRMAAARAAVGRLVAATPELDPSAPPDLVVAAGGAWAVAPGPAVTLALADVLRRPSVTQYAFDHARLLGPVGMIEDEGDRRLMLSDLADDLLEPLGSVVVASGIHGPRNTGRLVVDVGAAATELDLVPGGLQLVDLPPGQVATAELSFRDPVVIGTRGRRFDVEVSGGLGGLLVDLRDVPLRLPERSERRRELLAAWQEALWTGLEP